MGGCSRDRLAAAGVVAIALVPGDGGGDSSFAGTSTRGRGRWIVEHLGGSGQSDPISWNLAGRGAVAAFLAVLPGLALNLGAGGSLQQGLSTGDFWTLSVELQNPQHMLPHLWRMPEWLAWAAYLVLAALSVWRNPAHGVSRIRLLIMLGVVLGLLAASWTAIEVLHNLRLTVFQPFRLATVARGLALVLIAGRLVELWSQGGWFSRTRAVLIAVALAGDWMFVVVTLAELGATLAERAGKRTSQLAYAGLLAWGLLFLSRHDTESGHWPLLLVLGAGLCIRFIRWPDSRADKNHRGVWLRPSMLAVVWALPVLALILGTFWPGSLAARCCVRGAGSSRCQLTISSGLPSGVAITPRWRPGSLARLVPRRFGSGPGAAWHSTGQAAPIMRRGWPTGSPGSRTTSIFMFRPRSSSAGTFPAGTGWRPATTR